MHKLSAVTITKNAAPYLETFLNSLDFVHEIIVVDNGSTDETVKIAQKYTQQIYKNLEENLGKLKNYALKKAKAKWILLLDTDEIVSPDLRKEIVNLLNGEPLFNAYAIEYQNHFMGHALVCKAQKYAKVRLFKKGFAAVQEKSVHEEIVVKGVVGKLKNKINHYSFRSISQVIQKFNHYARLEMPELINQQQKVTFKHLSLYPLHMFWSIFFENEGYKDYIWGLLLALCFAYYEFMRYFYLLKAKS